MHDFMKTYAGIVERCFTSCCNDFTSKAMTTKEDTCVSNCIDKFFKHTERVGARFAESTAGESTGVLQGFHQSLFSWLYRYDGCGSETMTSGRRTSREGGVLMFATAITLFAIHAMREQLDFLSAQCELEKIKI